MVFLLAATIVAGCGSRQAGQQAPQAVEVKAMAVVQQDTPITYEYVGQVQAKNEVKLQAKVSGNIVAKMVTGGGMVSQGQPLFQIDRRQYEAAVLSAKAQLAQSQATLANSRRDTERYRQLAAQNAIAEQTYDTAESASQQYEAAAAANDANVQKAQADLQDTLIVSPIDGRIDVNDLSLGSFVTAGSTVIATISSIDPVFVQFSINENEYLKMMQLGNGSLPGTWGSNLKLVLSNGTEYPLAGAVEQIDRGMDQNTGTITVKAGFDNPQKTLLPGMFARVIAQGEVRQNAMLIPQRAVQELLGKTLVNVVGDGDKAESRVVKMGPRIGNLWIVEEGLNPGDRVIIEGTTKIQPGAQLKVTMVGLNDLQSSAKQ
ncbi:MAG TPA: efflux RND transporter periplasmic adaptor subunit [Methylomusa anaerophila]|nr:efflux RND transporter periplasmic adaptor subunit [Methylomusa anaerophila]HML88187.1 efflux RND transporter periplasmic adaptor subunit [Methylomusa anaerophila]